MVGYQQTIEPTGPVADKELTGAQSQPWWSGPAWFIGTVAVIAPVMAFSFSYAARAERAKELPLGADSKDHMLDDFWAGLNAAFFAWIVASCLVLMVCAMMKRGRFLAAVLGILVSPIPAAYLLPVAEYVVPPIEPINEPDNRVRTDALVRETFRAFPATVGRSSPQSRRDTRDELPACADSPPSRSSGQITFPPDLDTHQFLSEGIIDEEQRLHEGGWSTDFQRFVHRLDDQERSIDSEQWRLTATRGDEILQLWVAFADGGFGQMINGRPIPSGSVAVTAYAGDCVAARGLDLIEDVAPPGYPMRGNAPAARLNEPPTLDYCSRTVLDFGDEC